MSFHCLDILYVVVKVQSGDEGIRTPDPLLARQVLSQLSYIPMQGKKYFLKWA